MSPAFKPEVEGLERMLDGLEVVLEGMFDRLEGVLEGTFEVLEGTFEVFEGTFEVLEGTSEVFKGVHEGLEEPGVKPGATSGESNGGKRQRRQFPPPAANELSMSQLFSFWNVL